MEKMLELMNEYIIKTIDMTEKIIDGEFENESKLMFFVDNRERLISVIDQISQQINWNDTPKEISEEIHQKIEYIKKLDEKLLTKLQNYREEVRREIESNFRQKENLRGYNLNEAK